VIFTREQILFILTLIAGKYGPGYSDKKEVAALQAKLSIMLQTVSEGG